MNQPDSSNAKQATSPTPSFNGVAAQPIDVTLAKLCADVYQDSGKSIDGWSPVPEDELRSRGFRPSDLNNRQTGFHARIYADDKGNHVVVFQGTNEGKDWRHNVRQGTGLVDPQYEAAFNLAVKTRSTFGDTVAFAGHSLGGGLASVASLATGRPAVTFNSAGLHDNTIERLGMDADAVRRVLATNGQIRRYAVDGEILTSLQEERLLTRALLPDAIGHKIELPDPDPQRVWEKLIPGSSLKHGLDLHGMDSVLDAQQLASRGSMAHPAHPANGMFNDALAGLHGMQPDALGYASEEQYRNAAGSLVARARDAGLQKIDHVVIGANGALFAVEGPLEDARHRIASIDRMQAAAQPLEASSQAPAQVQRDASTSIEPALDTHRRAALTP